MSDPKRLCRIGSLIVVLLLLVIPVIILVNNNSPCEENAKCSLHSELFPESFGPHVRSNDIEMVKAKIKKISFGGKDKLQVIIDFDRTLSKYHSNGVLTASSYGIFASIPSVPQSYVQGAYNLYKKYGPIEENPKMPIDEKIPYMEEWWEEYKKLIANLPFNQESLEDAVVTNNVSLRDGSDVAFSRLNKSEVPVLVFSAGLGDVVDSVVRHNNLNYTNVKVISNFFALSDGHITGMKGRIIHVFNKNEHAIENSDYFKNVEHRENVILLGDSLGDSFMADGVPGHGQILKIGFLNSQIEESLPVYLKHFDLVLVDDQTMDVFNSILDCVLRDLNYTETGMDTEETLGEKEF